MEDDIMRTVVLVAVLFSLLLTGAAAYASDISGATFSGTIVVSNNSTATSNVATVMTLSSADLIDNYGVDTSFDRVAIRNTAGADVPFMPGYGSNPWALWVQSIGADSYMNNILYIGLVDMGATKYYFPGDSGMTISDDASLEPSDNFTVTKTGWFDTANGTDKYTVFKDEAYVEYISPTVSGNYTCSVLTWESPTSHTDAGGIWTDETNAYDQNDATFAYSASNANYLVLTPSSTIVSDKLKVRAKHAAADVTLNVYIYHDGGWDSVIAQDITTSAVYYEADFGGTYSVSDIRISRGGAGAGNLSIYELYIQKQASASAIGVPSGEHTKITSVTSNSTDIFSGGTATASGGTATNGFDDTTATIWVTTPLPVWIQYDFGADNYKLGVSYNITTGTLASQSPKNWTLQGSNDASAWTTLDTVTNEPAWTPPYEERSYTCDTIDEFYRYYRFNITAVQSSDYVNIAEFDLLTAGLAVNIDDTYFGFYLDGVTVPDNANDYVFFQNGVMPYVESLAITVGGNPVATFDPIWEYGSTFSDSSGNGNDATPTFRTTSSDADVSAALTRFGPISTARAPAFTIATAGTFYSDNITSTSNFSTTSITPGGLPGVDVVESVGTSSDTPVIWIWGVIGGFTIAMSGLAISWMERKFGGGTGTLLLRFGVAALIMGLMVTFDIFDFWMLVFYIMIALSPLLASRHGEVGANVSELNTVAFLATAFLGLSLINNILGKELVTSDEIGVFNNIMFTQTFEIFDLFSMPIINAGFFTQGIPHMLRWEYTFFGGNAQLIAYFLYSVTAVVALIVFMMAVGTIQSIFSRR